MRRSRLGATRPTTPVTSIARLHQLGPRRSCIPHAFSHQIVGSAARQPDVEEVVVRARLSSKFGQERQFKMPLSHCIVSRETLSTTEGSKDIVNHIYAEARRKFANIRGLVPSDRTTGPRPVEPTSANESNPYIACRKIPPTPSREIFESNKLRTSGPSYSAEGVRRLGDKVESSITPYGSFHVKLSCSFDGPLSSNASLNRIANADLPPEIPVLHVCDS